MDVQAAYAISKGGRIAAPLDAKLDNDALIDLDDDTSGEEDGEEGDMQIAPAKEAAKEDTSAAKDDKDQLQEPASEPKADKASSASLQKVLTSHGVPSETQVCSLPLIRRQFSETSHVRCTQTSVY